MPGPPVLLDLSLPNFLRDQIESFCEIWPWDVFETGSPESLKMVEGLYIYGHPQIDGPLLDRLPSLKVISNFGVGYDHIDVPAAHRRDVAVGHTPGAVDGATADMAMALLLGAARNLVSGDRFARSREFTHYDPGLNLGHEVHGSTLGIIGLGRIGQEVARRALAFDMEVLYHNRRQNVLAEKRLEVTYVSLDELLERSHFVSLNTPLTAETRNLIGREELQMMRQDAILVNTARGGVVDHDALTEALREGWIAGAALDVTEPEPLPRQHPLLSEERAIILPHLGSATVRTRTSMGKMAAENLAAGLKGQKLPHAV